MKKAHYLLSITAITIFITIYFAHIQLNKYRNHYTERMNEYVFHNNVFNDYSGSFEFFFLHHSRYPSDLNELKSFINSDKDYNFLVGLLKDPFSKHGSNLYYVPLYSNLSNLREGCALISTGIDGRINNTIKDTMYIDDIKKLKFYNNIENPVKPPYQEPDTTFSLINYLFGKRDLLVFYKDGIESFINNNRHFGVCDFYTRINGYKIVEDQTFDCTILGEVKEVTNIFVNLGNDSINIYCFMYKGREFSFIDGDSAKIAGQFTGDYDIEKNIIYLSNCIQIRD